MSVWLHSPDWTDEKKMPNPWSSLLARKKKEIHFHFPSEFKRDFFTRLTHFTDPPPTLVRVPPRSANIHRSRVDLSHLVNRSNPFHWTHVSSVAVQKTYLNFKVAEEKRKKKFPVRVCNRPFSAWKSIFSWMNSRILLSPIHLSVDGMMMMSKSEVCKVNTYKRGEV